MKKTFTTVLPDEPYKTSTKKNNVVECTYDGPRYLLIRVREEDGFIFCIDEEEEDLEKLNSYKIDQHKLDPEGVYQVVVDAMTNTWEAAYLTGYYTHDPFDDYEETLATGEKWTYHYDDNSCAAEQPFYVNDMFYEKNTGTFKRPRYRVHAVAKRDFWAGVDSQIETYEEVVSNPNYLDKGYNEEQIEKLRAHVLALKNIKTRHADTDHWKIPFPELRL